MTVRATLREGLLDGSEVVLAGEAQARGRLEELGATVHELSADLLGEEAVEAAAVAFGGASAVVCQTGDRLRAAGLDAAVAGAWTAARAIVRAHFTQSGGGLVLLVAPRPRDGEHARAAGAALENLARTTSVEWARLGVRVVTVRPADVTAPGALAELVAFLLSPAGAYYSGCTLELGAAGLPSSSS
jgi:NAD(P)-dependent dehydrogenase (short-subunit alcohol dehydrogenase family)